MATYGKLDDAGGMCAARVNKLAGELNRLIAASGVTAREGIGALGTVLACCAIGLADRHEACRYAALSGMQLDVLAVSNEIVRGLNGAPLSDVLPEVMR